MNTDLRKSTKRLPVAAETALLIRAGVSDNTLKAYRHASVKLETWLDGRALDDRLLAKYITDLHTVGKSPLTISLVVAAVKWTAKNATPPSPLRWRGG